MRRGPTRHVFVDVGDVDPVTGDEWCGSCNLMRRNAIHNVPESTVEQREYERRKVGDR